MFKALVKSGKFKKAIIKGYSTKQPGKERQPASKRVQKLATKGRRTKKHGLSPNGTLASKRGFGN